MSGFNLESATKQARWSPRREFGSSVELSERVYALGDGFYLRTNPRRGPDGPVLSVGWAESDYWARRAWDIPPFRGDLSVPPSQWGPVPSLAFLDRPEHLTFQSVCDFERSQPDARKVTMVTGRYRMTDGAFLCVEVSGSNGVTYYFASPGPEQTDLPVAIEVRLPEGT